MKKLILVLILLLSGCHQIEKPENKVYQYINEEGQTLKERINVPKGYTRIEGDFEEYLQNYPLEKHGSLVQRYDGIYKKSNHHVAIFKLPLENEDLQQCADSIYRMYGEYYYQKGEYEKIRYLLGNDFYADFKTWSSGKGISVNGNNISWYNNASHDTSYESFKKFMRIVFAYSGTIHLDTMSYPIDIKDIQVGDIFIKGGSPGHVVMVVDMCQKDGKKAFLLAQGYMPAQQFHILKNPSDEFDPWYYQEDITYPFQTPEYTFEKGSLKRIRQ